VPAFLSFQTAWNSARTPACTYPPDKPRRHTSWNADYATTGFLAIRKQVFTALMERFPERQYKNDIDAFTSLNADKFYDFFPVVIHPETRRFESEDYGFSRLAREAGFKIHCVTNLTLTHHGVMGFPCNLWKQMQVGQRQPQQPQQPQQEQEVPEK